MATHSLGGRVVRTVPGVEQPLFPFIHDTAGRVLVLRCDEFAKRSRTGIHSKHTQQNRERGGRTRRRPSLRRHTLTRRGLFLCLISV